MNFDDLTLWIVSDNTHLVGSPKATALFRIGAFHDFSRGTLFNFERLGNSHSLILGGSIIS
jgi:hypothetical protein